MARERYGAEVAEALGALLRRETRARLYAALTEGAAGVDEASYPVISGLARRGPCTAAELASDVGLDRSVVSRRATALQSAGLLARSPDPRDRRGTLLELTPAGRAAVAEMRDRLAAAVDAHLAGVPDADAAAFARVLRGFVEHGPFSEGVPAPPSAGASAASKGVPAGSEGAPAAD
ncbi:MarR family winged helix-turn-helix transcriptional regulator [Nocardiopsis composta]|uniref:DNA-binding MarR family transcriptional regulator n=1 Tax=Nocardiopsis composta TaxID=157465 RepID=A0A7W8VED8_9ACTN|nr:MarR family transcriptional regulator [Nocardiopsis composta]MBB5433197.1 DNA-binding MarR family transcriptional regulator [Nocardiopsis composta]